MLRNNLNLQNNNLNLQNNNKNNKSRELITIGIISLIGIYFYNNPDKITYEKDSIILIGSSLAIIIAGLIYISHDNTLHITNLNKNQIQLINKQKLPYTPLYNLHAEQPYILQNQPIRTIPNVQPIQQNQTIRTIPGVQNIQNMQHIPINFPTRGEPGTYTQLGALHMIRPYQSSINGVARDNDFKKLDVNGTDNIDVNDDQWTNKKGWKPGNPTNIFPGTYKLRNNGLGNGFGLTNNLNLTLPLYGRQTYTRSNHLNYFTKSKEGVRLEINSDVSTSRRKDCSDEYGCQELQTGDHVYVSGYNNAFRVKIYKTDKWRYLPYVY